MGARTQGVSSKVIAVAMALLVAGAGAHARAGATPARSIAVLEFRGGATGARNVGTRVAAILRKRTSRPILDHDDARRIYGAKIDEAVARCSGEAACIGAIGRKLGSDEVLLLGVSELGDLILAFQLVDSAGGTVATRIADSLPRDSEPDDAALEGYLKRLLPPADFVRWGTLRIEANLTGAEVNVAGTSRGVTPLPPIPVQAPSSIDLRVSKPGYIDFRARIDVTPDATVEVRPVLTPRPGNAWYERWWVWAIAGAVVAGGVTTAVVLAQPGPKSVPIDVHF
jgi:hypothetical protein